MIEGLKPCPFCGGKGELTFKGQKLCDDTVKGFIIVRCTTCGAAAKGQYYRGEPVEKWEYDIDETLGGAAAIEAWNRRTEESEGRM